MKIRERLDSQDQVTIKGAASAAADRARERRDISSDEKGAGGIARSDVEKVQIGLGRLINQELNPSAMAEERRAKIEAIKKAIGDGSYAVDSFLLAEKVAEEINYEVALAPVFEGGEASDDDESEKS